MTGVIIASLFLKKTILLYSCTKLRKDNYGIILFLPLRGCAGIEPWPAFYKWQELELQTSGQGLPKTRKSPSFTAPAFLMRTSALVALWWNHASLITQPSPSSLSRWDPLSPVIRWIWPLHIRAGCCWWAGRGRGEESMNLLKNIKYWRKKNQQKEQSVY